AGLVDPRVPIVSHAGISPFAQRRVVVEIVAVRVRAKLVQDTPAVRAQLSIAPSGHIGRRQLQRPRRELPLERLDRATHLTIGTIEMYLALHDPVAQLVEQRTLV